MSYNLGISNKKTIYRNFRNGNQKLPTIPPGIFFLFYINNIHITIYFAKINNEFRISYSNF